MLARRRLGGSLLSAASSTSTSLLSSRTSPAASSSISSSCFSVGVAPSLRCFTPLSSGAVSPALCAGQQLRYNASDAASTEGSGGGTALDVAMKVNKLKRMHQSGQGQGKKEIERMAWRELNTLSEQQIATAEGKAVALLLNSWAYFARFWEKGKDGPYEEVQRE